MLTIKPVRGLLPTQDLVSQPAQVYRRPALGISDAEEPSHSAVGADGN
jgi:hypothetical protein